MFRAMILPIIRSTWLYLQYLVLFTQVAAGWCLGWGETELCRLWGVYTRTYKHLKLTGAQIVSFGVVIRLRVYTPHNLHVSVSTHSIHQPAATWVNTTRYCKYSQVLLIMGENNVPKHVELTWNNKLICIVYLVRYFHSCIWSVWLTFTDLRACHWDAYRFSP